MRGAVDSVAIPLNAVGGGTSATLYIRTLPTLRTVLGQPALLDLRESGIDDLEPVQLVEGAEYLFEVTSARVAVFDKREIFAPDDATGLRGRLRPALSTGRVELVVSLDGVNCKPIAMEVRSVKLGYLEDYRWMLNDIARLGSELALERFAASEQRLELDASADAETIYHRFVFLRALLKSERIDAAIRRVLAAPYVEWRAIDRLASPSAGARGSASLARRFSAPGPREPWEASPVEGARSIPRRLLVTRTEETADNVPNRFLRHALEEWRALAATLVGQVEEERARCELAGVSVPAPVVRGCTEGRTFIEEIDDLLRHPVIAEVGRLTHFPTANQVLQRKDGYRDLFNVYMVYQFGSRLMWTGGEDVYGAGQRNVAALYEYWVFLALAKIVADICKSSSDLASLVSQSEHGLTLLLRRGEATCVGGCVTRRGRTFRLELWFNREFRANVSGGSWSRTMRPDCSIRIAPEEGVSPPMENLWLHFDAKYRVTRMDDLEGDSAGTTLTAKSEDLLKMHAYRDAIVSAAGAYVVYPGEQTVTRRPHDELVPSLGAFPLKPSGSSEALGENDIRRFISEVLDQLAEQGSSFERARYWTARAFEKPTRRTSANAVSFLSEPPADTLVLLGYIKGQTHLAWVERSGLYVLRADKGRRGAVTASSKELSARLLIAYGEETSNQLFSVVGAPVVITKSELLAAGYPSPSGDAYFGLHVTRIETPEFLARAPLNLALKLRRGAPRALTWLDIAAALGTS